MQQRADLVPIGHGRDDLPDKLHVLLRHRLPSIRRCHQRGNLAAMCSSCPGQPGRPNSNEPRRVLDQPHFLRRKQRLVHPTVSLSSLRGGAILRLRATVHDGASTDGPQLWRHRPADPPYQRLVELIQLAERHGFEYGWTYDSHVLWQESTPTLALAAAATERIKLGHMVTNPAPASRRSWRAPTRPRTTSRTGEW